MASQPSQFFQAILPSHPTPNLPLLTGSDRFFCWGISRSVLKLQVQDDTRRSQISENVGSVYIVLFISQSFFLCSHLSFLFHLFSVCHSFLFSFSVWFFFHSNDYCLNFSLANSLSYIIYLFISVFLLTPIP
jgi:hypothetical protein